MARKIETYGIMVNLQNLRDAARATTNYGSHSPEYDEVFYDRSTGEVWTKYQYSLGQNSWTAYHDPDVVKIGNFVRHVTQQQLMDCIKSKLDTIAMAETFNAPGQSA